MNILNTVASGFYFTATLIFVGLHFLLLITTQGESLSCWIMLLMSFLSGVAFVSYFRLLLKG